MADYAESVLIEARKRIADEMPAGSRQSYLTGRNDNLGTVRAMCKLILEHRIALAKIDQ